jgi:ribosomal protein L25 (general stress protein Ctc)
MYILKAENRSTEKKSKQLRREGIIPGEIYCRNKVLKIIVCSVFKKRSRAFLKNPLGRKSPVSVTLGAEKYTALLRARFIKTHPYLLR